MAELNPLSPFRWLAPAGARSRLSIFIFHRVLPKPDLLLPWEPDAERFDRIVRFIASQFHVLDLVDAIERLKSGRLPSAPACITFDDGYLDNLTVAAPILLRHRVTATFFIATAFSDGTRMWNDTVIETVRRAPAGVLDARSAGLPCYKLGDAASRIIAYEDMLVRLKHLPMDERDDRVFRVNRLASIRDDSPLMMSPGHVKSLAGQGMRIGGHTHRHPILTRLVEAKAREEIELNRDILTEWVGETPLVFAYPNGLPGRDYGSREIALVRAAGYLGAVTTGMGAGLGTADVYQLPRFTPWSRGMIGFGAQALTNLFRLPHELGTAA